MNNIHYYSLFFFVSDYSQIPRHILNKQLALTKSGRRFAIFNKITSIEQAIASKKDGNRDARGTRLL